jgi:hypothetical protein
MSQGFYEILGVEHQASSASIQAAFQEQLAELVRRLRAARRQGADVTILEGKERSLREAVEVLTDPVRRQRYDAYRRANRQGMPETAEGMWELAKDALVDPLAISSLDVLHQTTDLNIGNPFKVQPKPRQWAQQRQQTAPAPQQPAPQQPVQSPVSNGRASTPDPSTEITEQIERTAPPVEPAVTTPQAPLPVVSEPAVAPADAPVPTPPPLNDVAAIAGRFGVDGRFLSAVRELRKRSLDELADETRISLRYLHALESNDFDSLPAETFVRGYVKELARALEIHEVDVVEGYLALYRQQRG